MRYLEIDEEQDGELNTKNPSALSTKKLAKKIIEECLPKPKKRVKWGEPLHSNKPNDTPSLAPRQDKTGEGRGEGGLGNCMP